MHNIYYNDLNSCLIMMEKSDIFYLGIFMISYMYKSMWRIP
jgi:hypothetical protein